MPYSWEYYTVDFYDPDGQVMEVAHTYQPDQPQQGAQVGRDVPAGQQVRYQHPVIQVKQPGQRQQRPPVVEGRVGRGQPFAQVFWEWQFQVAGTLRTVFADSREVVPHLAPTYKYETSLDGQKFAEGKLTNNYAEFPPSRRTASGLNSTAEDVAHCLIALQQGQLLSTKTALNNLWTPGTYHNGSPTQWALGWVTKPRPRHRAVIATGGGRSAFFVCPEDDLAVVVLTNLAGAYPKDFIDEVAGYFNPEIPASDPITALRMQLQKQGFDQASAVFRELKKQDKSFAAAEVDLNDWAYRMMANRRLKEALAVFKLTLERYPKSWNAYDSYGEALVKTGQPEQAIGMYRKSVELNPDNQNGKRILARLTQ